jgi:hypothetical protein
METLYSRFKFDDPKDFIKTRDLIGKVFYLIFIAVYIVMWSIKKPSDVPEFSFYLTIVMTPILLFGLQMRAYCYLYLYNWFYILYYVTTGAIFFLAMSHFNPDYGKNYIVFEIFHLLIANVIGMVIGIIVSIPFKFMHLFMFDAKKFYYDFEIIEKINEKINPEKQAEKKIESTLNTLNETQLQIELKVAVEEERFEDADRIRKLLEKKF